MFAVDMDAKTFFLGKNGNWLGSSNPNLNLSPIAENLPNEVRFKIQIGSRECQPNRLLANFGNSTFKYDVPINYYNGYCTDDSCELSKGIDTDNDGIVDVFDKFPLINISNYLDTDSDGAPNNCVSDCIGSGMTSDDDDDNDGVLDVKDEFPLISLDGLLDSDGDGVPNDCDENCISMGMAADDDDDNDGILDSNDAYPTVSLNLLDNLNINFDSDTGFVDEELVWMRLDIAQSIISKFDAGRDATNEYAIAKLLIENNVLENWRHATYVELQNLIKTETGNEITTDITQVGFGLSSNSYLDKANALKLQENIGRTSSYYNSGAQGLQFRSTGHLETIAGEEIWAELVIYDYNDASFLTIRDRESQSNPDDSVNAGAWLVISRDQYNARLLLTDSDKDGIPDECGSSCQILNLSSDNDDDNDGLLDLADAYPLISIGNLVDTDSDGAPDNCNTACVELGMKADTDDDNDGALDLDDAFPLDAKDYLDSDNDGLGDNYELDNGLSISNPDFDADGLKDGAEIKQGTNPKLADSDDDGVIDGIDRFPLISIGSLLDSDNDGAPDVCDEACLSLGMTEDRDGIAPYTFLEQPTPQFAGLTPTAKIIVTGSEGENFFDVAKYISNATTDNPASVVGETFLISGSSDIDGFMVQPGVKYDLTNLKGGIDKLYFSGPLAEYADSILLDAATGVMQVSRLTDVGEEIVQFIATASAADTLIFTDGALSTADVKAAVSAQTPLTDLTLDTSIKALDDKTITGATVKHIVLNSDGGSVMGLGPSIKTLISGNSGIDQIYIPAGSIVDASNLKSGRDEITVEGNLADYDITLDASGNIVLNREVDIDDVIHTELVTLANGGNVATNDLVIFADQQLDTSSIKQQL
jgi:hypothetical protein